MDNSFAITFSIVFLPEINLLNMKKLMPESIIREKKEFAGLFFMALVIVVFSFPEIDLGFDIGIDPPLKWLFNHLFSEGLSAGRNIIFPHGPLAFFMYPLADNFHLSVFVTIVLQVVFVFQLFALIGGNKKQHWLLTALLAWFIFSLSNFNQLIISNVSISYLLFLKDGKPLNKYWGFVLTAFAFYVKAWVAIITGTLTFSLFILIFFRNKNLKESLIDVVTLLGLMYMLWIIMYGSISGFINYCIGMMHLAGDNSAAAAYHPVNNWLLVIPLILSVFLLPFIRKTNESKTFGLLFLLSFFAAWKYGMAREDYSHARTYLFFLCVSMILFVIYKRKDLIMNISVIVVASVLFVLNMKNVENPQPLTINNNGILNFAKYITSYSEIKKACEEQNLKNIESNRLPDQIRKEIAGSTVDIYPWDYTIVAANQLNWKARPVIQSYAAYTSWLDQKNAAHFGSSEAPEYFIFDLNKITFDFNGGKLESIDNRYLLNDEPQTIIQIIQNYQLVFSDKNFLVYRKREHALEMQLATKPETAQWNEWVSVPDSTSSILRMKLQLEKSLLGKTKSFLYKDELYYVYLKTERGETLKYRIVPQNAIDGIWVAPFYTSAGNSSPCEKITDIMLTCSNSDMVKTSFSYQWEFLNNDELLLNAFFGKDSLMVSEVYLNEYLNFESNNTKWKGYNEQNIVNDSSLKQKAYNIASGMFSPSFTFYSDSLPQLPARVTVDCWLKTFSGANANLIIETENASGEKIWHGIEIYRQMINYNERNHVFNFLDLNDPATKVSVYFWNHGKKPVMIFGLEVKVGAKL